MSLVRDAAARLRVSERALRAVLRVECGSDDPARWLGPGGRAIVRVEAHHVLRRSGPTTWGLRVRAGAIVWQGGPGEPTGPWMGHEVEVDGAWWSYHGRQEREDGWPGEYDALDVATLILGAEGAAACSSWGPGQVIGSAWRELGLGSATEVREHAATPAGGLDLVERFLERAKPWALEALRAMDWPRFVESYNGRGQVGIYVAWLEREIASLPRSIP